MDHPPETEREVCPDMDRGDDLQNRQLGDRRQGVGRQGQCRGPGPGTLQCDVLEAVFNELTDPRTAIDMRNDLEQEVRPLRAASTFGRSASRCL